MFELSLQSAKTLKECVDAIATLIDEGHFEVGADGVKLRAMDPSQVAMVDFFLPKTAFEKYDVKNEARIALNMDDLSRVTSRYRPEEKLTLKLDDSKARLTMVFKGKHTRRFNLPLLDITHAPTRQPKIEFDSRMRIQGGALKEALKDAALVSSYVVLRADTEGFVIEANGDKGNVTIETAKNDEVLLEHAVGKESRSMFPLEYLNDILKAADAGAPVSLDLKTNAPLRVEYSIGDAAVVYYLAPRVEG
ncbi:proliferating cell nuclear antigen (pcna) [Candidatus Micrarchaeota archaeon]|nr:proliferating cell nuclear antigen (pcna) [Candidatus Micrarchaeota archaeon]